MEIRSKELRKALIQKIKDNKNVEDLNFLLLYNPKLKENEYYINNVSKTLSNLNIRHTIKRTSNYEETKKFIESAAEFTSILLARPTLCHNEDELFDLIPLAKDCDMLSTLAKGKLTCGDLNYLPATAKAVKLLIDEYNIEVKSKEVLIIGRSKSVGSPLASLLLKLDGSISIVHSKTPLEKIKEKAKKSDIIVLASGQRLLEKDDIKQDSIIIDCGYNEDGQGDLGFIPLNASFTPVPGGVGPLTTISIVLNALYLWENSHR